MNAYGPSFRYINKPANHVVFEHKTVHWFYTVNIDLKLDGITPENKANIFGLTDGAAYNGIGSQIPAVYTIPGDEGLGLQICTFIDGASYCNALDEDVTAGEWFNLKVEQRCWWDLNGDFWCYIFVLVDNELEFFMWNDTPTTFYNVAGIVGNTYGQDDIAAASGKYANFNLDQCEVNDADDIDNCNVPFSIADQPTHADAVNVA